MPEDKKASKVSISLWDVSTRLTHWLFVCLVACSWWTEEIGEMDWHAWSGYALLTLIVFRLYWGFVGSSSARFGSFIVGPGALKVYAQELFRTKSRKPALGHNPIGGWSVMAMLILMLLQIGLGLFAVDVDGIESGPLSYYVSFDLGRDIADWHELAFNALLVFIAIHISAIVFYLVFKKMNLITPMVTGRTQVSAEDSTPADYPTFVPLWRALVGLGLSAGITWLIVTL